MANNLKDKSRAVHFDLPAAPAGPSSRNVLVQDSGTQQLSRLVRTRPENIAQSDHGSLWELPGIDKVTFYAAALYLHTVTDGLEGRLWPRGSKTRPSTRNFLDSLADCFARSKARDAPDHVSATAMVRSQQRKEITLYIAKNRSSKPSDASEDNSKDNETASNENKVFAQQLIGWFNELAGTKTDSSESYEIDPDDHRPVGDEIEGDQSDTYSRGDDDSESNEPDDDREFKDLPEIFSIMCNFSQSRLAHYVEKTGAVDPDRIDPMMDSEEKKDLIAGWQATKSVLVACKQFQDRKLEPGSTTTTAVGLATCAFLAGKARRAPGFRQLAREVSTSAQNSRLRRFELPAAIEGVKYLGRLYAAFLRFSSFCTHERQQGWSFRYVLLKSLQETWNGQSYLQKVQSWTGSRELALEEAGSMKSFKTIQQLLEDNVQLARDMAPVHCEMQLLMHFLRRETPTCFDYFGCSKKSCWLCWHMMAQNQKFSMKDTHRKLYPRWAFSFDFSRDQENVAEGLRIAYNDMISLVQNRIIRRTEIRSIGPFQQSSARLTPANQRDEASKFDGDYIGITDRINLFRIRALHIPEDTGKPERQVDVAFYKLEEVERHPMMRYMELDDGYFVAAGFHMITNRNITEEISELNQYQEHFWHLEMFYDRAAPRMYWMYFRSADFPMQPNKFVLDAWRHSYGEPDKSSFPWRGDIFIFSGDDKFSSDTSLSGIVTEPYLTAPSDVNRDDCFHSLIDFFESNGADYVEKRRKNNRKYLEHMLDLARDVAKRSSLMGKSIQILVGMTRDQKQV